MELQGFEMSKKPGLQNHRSKRSRIHSACACFLLISLMSVAAIAETSTSRSDEGFAFALIGDMPYDARQREEFLRMMAEINSTDLAFVVHVGDFWFDGAAWKPTSKGLPPCDDETMRDRLRLAKDSVHPFVLVPGDNDWTDCHRAKPQAYDPMERLAILRGMFFDGPNSLGQRTLPLSRQSESAGFADFPENVRWSKGGVLFVTLHIVGSNNNLGRSSEMDQEYTRRNEANLAWLRDAFALATQEGYRAVVIMAQANLQFENAWSPRLQKRYLLGGLGIEPHGNRRETGFDVILEALEEKVVAFGKPVLYLHGDTHTFRIDKPMVGTSSGRMIENFTRVETFGYRNTHWVRITINPGDPEVFTVKPMIVEANRVRH